MGKIMTALERQKIKIVGDQVVPGETVDDRVSPGETADDRVSPGGRVGDRVTQAL